MSASKFGDLIGAIDEGTSSARFVLFKAGTADIVCYHQLEIQQITPSEGWVEQDAMLILRTVEECIEKTIEKLISLGGSINASFSQSYYKSKMKKHLIVIFYFSIGYCRCWHYEST